jgi:hypothetical protein
MNIPEHDILGAVDHATAQYTSPIPWSHLHSSHPIRDLFCVGQIDPEFTAGRCTVFANTEVMSMLTRNKNKDDFGGRSKMWTDKFSVASCREVMPELLASFGLPWLRQCDSLPPNVAIAISHSSPKKTCLMFIN